MSEAIGETDEVFHSAGDDADWKGSGWFGGLIQCVAGEVSP